MRPSKPDPKEPNDLFRARLSQQIDRRHPLVRFGRPDRLARVRGALRHALPPAPGPAAAAAHAETGQPARRFREFLYATLDSWSRARRVIGKAEHLAKGAKPRFIVTSLPASAIDGQTLYERVYYARGDMENRVWTPPALQAGFFFAQACVVGCCYVSGLLSPMPSGPDEIRELAPDHQGELGALRFSRALPTPIRPACHRVKDHPRSSWKSEAVAGSHRSGRCTMGFAAAEHRPVHPRQLVGNRGNDDVERATGEQRVDPRPTMPLAALGEPDQRSRTVHQLATQIAVATLADPEQPFLTARGMLAGRQTEPGGEASTTAEEPGIADRCHHGGGDDRSDPGSLSKTPTGFVVPRLPDQAPIESGDPGLDLAQVLHLQHQELARQRWQPHVIA